MRKFFIQAGNGLRYNLQNRNKCFLNEPSGLGFAKDNTYISVGNYFIVDDSKNEQKTISGILLFNNDWYANYKEFITFIKSYSDYKLVYKYDDNDYYIDIDIISVEKGDTAGNKYLECNIEMQSKSLWYRVNSITRTIEQIAELPQWDWNFDLRFNDVTLDKIDINNTGQCETSFEFELNGVIDGITLQIFKDGIVINEITFDIELTSSDSLIYSNKDNDIYLYKKTGNTLTNVFDCLDLEKNNFAKLPIGESSIKFTSELGNIASVTLTYFEEFEAV